LEKGTDKNLS